MDGGNDNLPAVPLPGIDIQLARNVGGDRQIVLKTMVAQDTDPKVLDGVLDTMMRRIDRQAAIYDTEGLEREIRDHEQTLRRFRADLEDVDARHIRALAIIDEQIREIQVTRAAALEEGRLAHEKSGRTMPFEPKGALYRTIDAHDRAIESKATEKEKAEQERLVALKNLHTNIARYEEEILIRQERLDKLRQIVG